MDFIKKIQNLPERKRKIIFWIMIILIACLTAFFFVKNTQNRIKNFDTENFAKNFPKFPKIDIFNNLQFPK